jgi:sugar lactone lactonase YvrE
LNGWIEARRMRRAACRLLVGAGVVLAAGTPLEAARTRTFSADSYEEFRRGEISGVVLTDDGRAALGPAEEVVADPGVQTIWMLTGDGRDGVVLATGSGGLVAARGPGEKDEVRPLATLFDAELFALCSDGRGTVYAAGAPVGTITRITADGNARPLFDVPEGVVFALLAAPDGAVYAATGDRGRLYRISAGGEGKVIYEAPDLSLRSLAWAPNGRIWAGTDPRGLVLEIDPASGNARIWYDAPEDEIVAFVPREDGSLIFAANPRVNPGDGGDEPGVPGKRGGESRREGRTEEPLVPSRPGVYRMSPDGSVRRIWSSPEAVIHSLAAAPDDQVWVATSEKAAVYRISPAGRQSLVWRAKEAQVLSLWSESEGLWVGTGGPGRLYRLGPKPATEGTLTGAAIDAGDQARWGALRWVAVGGTEGLRFETRTGYTETPDEAWSSWSSPQAAGPDWMVSSPPGRFLQWRALFSGSGTAAASLERVDVAGATANASPRISVLRLSQDEPLFTNPDQGRGGVTQVLPNGVQIDYSLPSAGGVTVTADEVPQWVRRLRSVVWDAQDPDGDELDFTLELRAVGEPQWRRLADDLQDRGWTLDQSQLPDGLYEIRLTASDAPGNPEAFVLQDARVTPPFRVDTVPPVLSEVRVRRTDDRRVEVSGVATDDASPVRRIEVSLDGERFRWLAPDDGLLDSRVERFSGRIPQPDDGSVEWIVVRAQDAAGNRGLHRAWLEP